MRIKLTIDARNLVIPQAYQHIIQANIYKLIDSETASKIHDTKTPKYLCFSLLQGDFICKNGYLRYQNYAYLEIGCVHDDVIMQVIKNIYYHKYFDIMGQNVFIKKIEIDLLEFKRNSYLVDIISPVTLSDSIDKKTFYYNPYDESYIQKLNLNFKKKFNILEDMPLIMHDINNVKKIVTKYKDFIIEAYKYNTRIDTKPEYMKLLYDAGLGDRNSYGFGMIRVIE